tara:strand:+ start:345 stop:803 length:459 start_codon:yes stop_codon:yes gene_type:complete
MSNASNYIENELLDHVLGEGSRNYTPPTLYLALFADTGSGVAAALESGTNSTSGTGNWGYYEINNGNYARVAVNFNAASSGSATNDGAVPFAQATANYDTAGGAGNVVTHIAIMDASTAGNVLFYGALSVSKTVTTGDTFQINDTALTVSLA